MQITIHPERTTCKLVTIPIYPHLKKFIFKFYEIPPDSPFIDLERHTGLYVAMNSCIRSKQKKRSARDEYTGTERYTEPVTFLLTSKLSRLTLTHAIVIRFSNEFDKLFKESFYQWVIAQDNSGLNNSEAIRSFKAHYNIIEGEYSFENFRRLWRRYNEKARKMKK